MAESVEAWVLEGVSRGWASPSCAIHDAPMHKNQESTDPDCIPTLKVHLDGKGGMPLVVAVTEYLDMHVPLEPTLESHASGNHAATCKLCGAQWPCLAQRVLAKSVGRDVSG